MIDDFVSIASMPNELLEALVTDEELSPYAKVRQRRWAEKVHAPLEEKTMAAIRQSNARGLPYGDAA